MYYVCHTQEVDHFIAMPAIVDLRLALALQLKPAEQRGNTFKPYRIEALLPDVGDVTIVQVCDRAQGERELERIKAALRMGIKVLEPDWEIPMIAARNTQAKSI